MVLLRWYRLVSCSFFRRARGSKSCNLEPATTIQSEMISAVCTERVINYFVLVIDIVAFLHETSNFQNYEG